MTHRNYYVYDAEDTGYATIHKGSCFICNEGAGRIYAPPQDSRFSQPLPALDKAILYALIFTNKQVWLCGRCLKGERRLR